jgi:HD-like signal output (HDOD) protein
MQTQIDQQLSTSVYSFNKDDSMSIKDQLIDMICNNPDLPTLGTSIASVVQISSSVDESTQQLANFILSDVSLTQKILRLSNSATFRTSSNPVITNVSKSIQLLGLDTIKACALAMILVDGIPSNEAKYIRLELELALSASLIGRQLAKRCLFPNAEEVAIAALFKNMGRLLLAAYDDDLYRETMALVKKGTHTKAQASSQMLGCTFDTLTEIAMRKWLIPDSIINAMKLMPSKVLTAPKNRQEWMQQVAEFSESSAALVLQTDQSTEDSVNEKLLNRFGTALSLNSNQLETLITKAAEETRELCNYAQLEQPQNENDTVNTEDINTVAGSNTEEDLLDGLLFESTDSDSSQTIKCHPSGKPFNSHDQLLTGIQNITEMIASKQYRINGPILEALETLHSGLGFCFATICLKDVKTNQYRARHSLGKNNVAIQQNFVCPSTSSDDLFSLAYKRNVDLSISDCTVPKMRSMLPKWHRKLLPNTQSFIVLPLIVKDQPIGFFYADRQQVAPEGISSDEMKLIKILKGQVLTALNSQ